MMMCQNALRMLTLAGCAISCYAASKSGPVVYKRKFRAESARFRDGSPYKGFNPAGSTGLTIADFPKQADPESIVNLRDGATKREFAVQLKELKLKQDRLKWVVWHSETYELASGVVERAKRTGTFRLTKIDDDFRESYNKHIQAKLQNKTFRAKYEKHKSIYDLPAVGSDETRQNYVPQDHVTHVSNTKASVMKFFDVCDKEVDEEVKAAAAEEASIMPMSNPMGSMQELIQIQTANAKDDEKQQAPAPTPIEALSKIVSADIPEQPETKPQEEVSTPRPKRIETDTSLVDAKFRKRTGNAITRETLPAHDDIANLVNNRFPSVGGWSTWRFKHSLMNSNLPWRNEISNTTNMKEAKKYYVYLFERSKGLGDSERRVFLVTVSPNITANGNYILHFTHSDKMLKKIRSAKKSLQKVLRKKDQNRELADPENTVVIQLVTKYHFDKEKGVVTFQLEGARPFVAKGLSKVDILDHQFDQDYKAAVNKPFAN